MRFPNLRYGNPNELAYYAQFYPKKERVRLLSRQLRRSERTIRNWLDGKEKLPWWVTEIIRLQKMEHDEMMRQMGMKPSRAALGVVSGTVIEFTRAKEKPQAAPADTGVWVELRRMG